MSRQATNFSLQFVTNLVFKHSLVYNNENRGLCMLNIINIDKELEINSTLDIAGLVRQLKVSNYLMPMFEAVVNSIQSIYLSKIKNGYIEIYINRSSEQQNIEFDNNTNIPYKVQEIDSIVISDNGLGFNNENTSAFNKAYYTSKVKLGCKGIGRFSWLKMFDSVEIESVFEQQEQKYKRQFTYKLPMGIDRTTFSTNVSNEKDLKTIVKLKGLKTKYSQASKQKIETIAKKILEHCFYYISSENAPEIVIKGYDNENKDKEPKSISINELYKNLYSKNVVDEKVNIKNSEFNIKHIKLFDTGEEENHKVYFCGNNRMVLSDTVKNITKLNNLEEKIQDTETTNKFYYIAYVSGAYLDDNTDPDREGFTFTHKDLPIDMPDHITLSDIKNGISDNLVSYIAPYLDIVQKNKMERIAEVVNQEISQYNYLLNEDEKFFDDISLYADKEDIKKKIKIKHIIKRDEVNRNFENFVKETDLNLIENDNEYEQKLKKFVKEIDDVGRADLAEYVAHRKVILEYYEKYLGWNEENNKPYKEEFIHNLIYPMGTTSNEIPYEKHNLWIIDDKLAFADFISSDKAFNQLNNIHSESNDRADLLFDSKKIFSNNDNTDLDTVTIVEFKRPERDDYTDKDNPIAQIYRYIDTIKEGKVRKSNGRQVSVVNSVKFYCYIICDITDKIKSFAKMGNFIEMPDGNGYFLFSNPYNAYIEIISFNKVLQDCKKRNNILFKKLGLEK